MSLQSYLFAGDSGLEACATSNAAHIQKGASGAKVAKIQTALMILDNATIDSAELEAQRYGQSTAKAVLAYKTKRGIVNRTYQSTADDIVGIMTITAMDKEMLGKQVVAKSSGNPRCFRNCPCQSPAGSMAVLDGLRSAALARMA